MFVGITNVFAVKQPYEFHGKLKKLNGTHPD